MIVVTGGAGFIGSNLVKQLNAQGRTDIVVIDDLTDGTKFDSSYDRGQPADAQDGDELIRKADAAMYRAKQQDPIRIAWHRSP